MYFDDAESLVKRRFIGSQFMGTATAAETLDSFKEDHCDLDYVHNMIQISMAWPNVNRKMVEIANEQQRTPQTNSNEHRKEQDPDAPSLLEMGSCGLHVLHGAYKTAQSVTSWKLDKFLKNCFSIFKKSPARRS